MGSATERTYCCRLNDVFHEGLNEISARVDGKATVDRKMEALAKHATQVQTDGPFFAGAESGHSWWSEEYYRLVKGTAGPVDADGFEADLFAGL